MKQQKCLITIDNPCSQDWSSMTPNNAGRFCTHCSKTVIDFQHMTDAEMLKVITKQSNELCGRFNTSQLNREIVPNEFATHSRFQKILAGFLLIAGSGISSTKAQQPSINADISIYTRDYSLTTTRAVTGKMIYPFTIIWGRVIDSVSKLPVHNAVINIKNCNSNVITDSNGEFKFHIPDSMLDDSIILTIHSIDYVDKNILIDKKELGKKQDFFIVFNPPGALGGVVSIRPIRENRWHKLKRKFL
jgi:hypothetical protein